MTWLILLFVIGWLLFCAYAFVSTVTNDRAAEKARIATECSQ
jgi:hypothetical protein